MHQNPQKINFEVNFGNRVKLMVLFDGWPHMMNIQKHVLPND